jgi:7-carboxy-7-deazaguanine synthase
MTVDAVCAQVRENGHGLVLVTGGEPLLQKSVARLMEDLLADGRRVILETSGTRLPDNALPLTEVPAGVSRIVDLKPPASGIPAADLDWEAIATLNAEDELKLVLAGREDYEWGRQLVRQGKLPWGVRVSFSPAQGLLEPRALAEWILADKLPVCFQIQLHKVVWPDVERGV